MNKRQKLVIFILSLVLGLLIGIQYKTVQANYLEGVIPTKRSVQLKQEIEALRVENEEFKQLIIERERELAEITDNMNSEDAKIKNLQLQLEKFRLLSGVTDVVGEGVIISIDDAIGDEENQSLPLSIIDNEQYIQLVINELSAAGAEVMSINDERILSITEIRHAGDKLYVNGKEIAAPIVIKAIGNSDVLYSAINAEFAIGQQIRTIGFQIDTRKVAELDIYKYADAINYRYATAPKE